MNRVLDARGSIFFAIFNSISHKYNLSVSRSPASALLVQLFFLFSVFFFLISFQLMFHFTFLHFGFFFFLISLLLDSFIF